MRLNRKLRWTAVLFLFALGSWLIDGLFPDQMFFAYQEALHLVGLPGPRTILPASGMHGPEDGLTHEPSWKPYVVLPASAAVEVSWRGAWQPTAADIGGLELSLPVVPQPRPENWPPNSLRIDHPERYFRQYVAVVRKGKRLIYVNAVCSEIQDPDWQKRLAIVMDGGTCCWQALYDPKTHTFLTLEINGVA